MTFHTNILSVLLLICKDYVPAPTLSLHMIHPFRVIVQMNKMTLEEIVQSELTRLEAVDERDPFGDFLERIARSEAQIATVIRLIEEIGNGHSHQLMGPFKPCAPAAGYGGHLPPFAPMIAVTDSASPATKKPVDEPHLTTSYYLSDEKGGALQSEAEKLQTEITELKEIIKEFENYINDLKERYKTSALDAEKIGKMVWKKKSRIAIGMVGLLGSSVAVAVGDLPSVVGIACSVVELGTVVGSVCKEVKKWKKEHRVCKRDRDLALKELHQIKERLEEISKQIIQMQT